MEKTNINENSAINDIRSPSAFKGITFSNYKKTDVRTEFIDNMKKGKIEPACNWCAELICAGHFMEAWESILHYIGKHIHLGNPKLIIYLDMRYNIFRNIMMQGHFTSEIQLRNNFAIRRLFAEIICNLTLSNKKHSFEPIKINRVEEFDMTQMTERLKAPAVKYIEPVFQKEDPKELFIAVNELAYNLSCDCRNMTTACYWIEWMLEFDIVCKNRSEPCRCQRRTDVLVENKYQRDIIWIVWDALIYYSGELKNPFIDKLMTSIRNLFCIKYTTGSCKKRRYLLYFAVAIITEPVPTNIEIISNKEILHNVVSQIDDVYKQIKKNEMSPGTDYLFSNLDKQNTFENSVKKITMMENMDIVPRNNV
jgi:hypothetical protein